MSGVAALDPTTPSGARGSARYYSLLAWGGSGSSAGAAQTRYDRRIALVLIVGVEE